jgi:flavin-dependent dehydrogenase
MGSSSHVFDVIVVGAGPCGATAAALLGQRGQRVLLLDRDRFPRDKTCGDGVTFLCAEHLEALGIGYS